MIRLAVSRLTATSHISFKDFLLADRRRKTTLKKSRSGLLTPDRIVFGGIILLLVFAPLAFGLRHVWAYTVVQIGVFSLGLLYLLDKIFSRQHVEWSWVRTPLGGFILVLLLIGMLQAIPMPPALVAFLSPETAADKAPLMELLARDTQPERAFSGWIPLTYNRHATGVEWLKMATYAALFFLVLNSANTHKRIEMLVTVLLLVGCFEAVYAIYQVFSPRPNVWWWPSRVAWASGTFIGSNHFAGYMEMIASLGLGYVVALRGKVDRSRSERTTVKQGFKKKLHRALSESGRSRVALFFYITLIVGIALLLSGSRGGILAASISMLLVSLLFMAKAQYRRQALGTMAVCLVIFGYGYYIGIDRTLNKFQSIERQFDNRMLETRVALPMVYQYPVAGVGMGGLPSLYPRYAPPAPAPEFARRLTGGNLHNDWVTLGAELGVSGFILVLVGTVFFITRMLRVWYRRRDPFAVGIGVLIRRFGMRPDGRASCSTAPGTGCGGRPILRKLAKAVRIARWWRIERRRSQSSRSCLGPLLRLKVKKKRSCWLWIKSGTIIRNDRLSLVSSR